MAFGQCTNLKSIIVPFSVNYINNSVFINCNELSYVRYLGYRSPEYYSMNLFQGTKVIKVIVPQNYSGSDFCFCPVEKYVITNGFIFHPVSPTQTNNFTRTTDFTITNSYYSTSHTKTIDFTRTSHRILLI